MATSSGFLSEDQFLCSICLDVFNEPVSTPCGHTFCKACLNRHWEGKQGRQCPMCNNKFNKDLKLSVNNSFREIVEAFKKPRVTAEATSSGKPREVLCDICSVNKIRASKTCLVCLSSFCDRHLEPHLRVAALKRHKLSDPDPDLEEKICKEHNQIFEFFCLNDHVSFCALCTEHIDNFKVRLNEEYVDQRSHIQMRTWNEPKIKHENNRKSQSRRNIKVGRPENVTAQETINPHQVNGCNCMYHNPGILRGKHFFECDVNGREGCDLAAVRISALGTFPPKWDENCIVRFSIVRSTKRLTVLLDYDVGLVLILDPDNEILMHKFIGSTFNEPIIPLFITSQSKPSYSVQSLKRRLQEIKDNSYFWAVLFAILILLYKFVYL
ncbi:E3 ubiquitin-protein ligase TRIM47-like [Cyprinodon tularosa]|uniref:E3 ubiquitin-protein ligase TRIM47-like n=1 Tax=Cyprinodon tularosa TaxID=77115 RepID=UPI0018E287F1|nr:E3 ubiquitin-protein ligase TRIM47-like [Cyprinodon tularosa]